MTKLLVFDMDDTLYLESDYVLSGFLAASKKLEGESSKQFLKQATEAFISGERGNIFNTALNEIGLDDAPELVSKLLHTYRYHTPTIQLCEDADSFLSSTSQQAKTALISDGYLPPQKLKAEALKLYDRLDQVILTEELGRDHWKPHPFAFETLEKKFGVAGSQCVYIGDNPAKDFVAPKNLGWHTVRIKRQGGLHLEMPDLEASRADVQIESFDQLDLSRLQ